jgi:rSAM/selenodomain-associated transferase 2
MVGSGAAKTHFVSEMERISVIIPTLNEATILPHTLNNLLEQNPAPAEIIVVDGGSADNTIQIAEARVFVIQSSNPVTRQMNVGARHAIGELLIFLHADCWLEQNAFAELTELAASRDVVGGAFQLRLVGTRPILDRFLSWSGNWNARHSQVFLGDHAIFCRREIFLEIGGFPDVPLMYEFEFMRNLRARGKLIQLKKRCYASARRFEQNGYWKTILLMRSLRTFYRLGLPINRLQRAYQRGGAYA